MAALNEMIFDNHKLTQLDLFVFFRHLHASNIQLVYLDRRRIYPAPIVFL